MIRVGGTPQNQTLLTAGCHTLSPQQEQTPTSSHTPLESYGCLEKKFLVNVRRKIKIHPEKGCLNKSPHPEHNSRDDF